MEILSVRRPVVGCIALLVLQSCSSVCGGRRWFTSPHLWLQSVNNSAASDKRGVDKFGSF